MTRAMCCVTGVMCALMSACGVSPAYHQQTLDKLERARIELAREQRLRAKKEQQIAQLEAQLAIMKKQQADRAPAESP